MSIKAPPGKTNRQHPLGKQLLQWYRANRVLYPWRRTSDAYKVWLSEILLQQTRIPVVLQYYEKILNRYPTLQSLASASSSDFISLWSGIGYYRRAENMVRCARYISDHLNGRFPESAELLEQLPGIGKYTAGAISNVCFGKLTPALDGNISRVLARLTNNKHPRNSPDSRRNLQKAFLHFGAGLNPGEYFQSLMELGEKICLPQPACSVCPVQNFCEAKRRNQVHRIPTTIAKREPVTFHWYLLALQKGQQHFFVQNQSREFLKSAWIFPDVLTRTPLSLQRLANEFKSKWRIDAGLLSAIGSVSHSVTYRKVHCHVVASTNFATDLPDGKWLTVEDLKIHPTSSIMHKVFGRLIPSGHKSESRISEDTSGKERLEIRSR